MNTLEDLYGDPEKKWPFELVNRIDNAYSAMQSTVNYWQGRFGGDIYFPAMLCRRCRDLIVNAVGERYGPDTTPLLLQFEDHVGEMKQSKFKMRNKLEEGQYPISKVFKRTDCDRLSAEQLVVREHATKFIESKQAQLADPYEHLNGLQRRIMILIRDEAPIKLVSLANEVDKSEGHVSRTIKQLREIHGYKISEKDLIHPSGDPGFFLFESLD